MSRWNVRNSTPTNWANLRLVMQLSPPFYAYDFANAAPIPNFNGGRRSGMSWVKGMQACPCRSGRQG